MPEHRIEIRNDYCVVCNTSTPLTVVAFSLEDRHYLGVCLECLERMAKTMRRKYTVPGYALRLTSNSYVVMFDNAKSDLELAAGCDCSVCGTEDVLAIEARYYATSVSVPTIDTICVDCIQAAISSYKGEFIWATC